MRILCAYGTRQRRLANYLNGLGRVFTALGHDWVAWSPDRKPAFDAFAEASPDLFVARTSDLSRAVQKNIVSRPAMKTALLGSCLAGPGCQLSSMPVGLLATDAELASVRTVQLRLCRPWPEVVFVNGSKLSLNEAYRGWVTEMGVAPIALPPAADLFIDLPGVPRPEFASDVAFIGRMEPHKEPLVLSLCHPESGLCTKVWGDPDQPTGAALPRYWPVSNYLGVADDAEVKDIIASARVCPDVNPPHAVEYGVDLSDRPYRVLASGGRLLWDEGPVSTEVLLAGVHQAVERFEDPEWVRLTECEREVVLRDQSYCNRVADLLTGLGLSDEAGRCQALQKRLLEGRL